MQQAVVAETIAPILPVAEKSWLDFLWLEITARCNLECGHCYAESGPHRSATGAMRTQDWLSVIRQARDLGCESCQFIGGEPTLHPDFRRLADFAFGLGMQIEVYTNATRLTADLVNFLAARQVRVATSFYSRDPAVHDQVTRRPGSWERTVAGIERVLQAKLPLRAGIIETEDNPGHFLGAKEFLEKLGVAAASIGYDRERGIGRGEHQAVADPMLELCGRCWQGRLCVTADAIAYPCVFSRFAPIGDVREGLRELLESRALSEFRDELREHRATRGAQADCAPGQIPCKPDQQPVCNPDYCTPIDCPPTGDCPPNSCHPHIACAPNEPCVPQTA